MAQTAAPTEVQSGTHAIEAYGVGKSFGKNSVLDNSNLQVPRGELYGLIGPSGCGKTTLVRVLAGLSRPDSGSVRLLGQDPIRRSSGERMRTGYMPQGSYLFPNLSVQQNARFVAGLYGLGWIRRGRRIRELLEHFELWSARGRRVSQLSGGMQRRLTLACAVVHRPEVVFVDEPTVGLDPILRAKIWEYLHAMRSDGTTIILTTQYVEEAANCDRVGMMLGGRIITSGTPEELRRHAFPSDTAEVEGEGFTTEARQALEAQPGVTLVEPSAHGIRVTVDNLATATPMITRVLMEHGATVHSIVPHAPTYDEVFAELIAHHG